MFEFMVFVLVMAFYVSLGLALLMVLYRGFLAIKHEGSLIEKALIFILPLGIGVFLYRKNDQLKRIYHILIMILFITSILASLFLFHRELGL